MQIGKLDFEKFESGASFLAQPVKDKIIQMSEEEQSLCFVAQIDKEDMGGQDLCDKYEIDTKIGVNCLIVKGKLNGEFIYCALLVPVGNRYDINGVLKNKLGCRMSVAPLDEVLEITKMEYGSINPIGLPKEWKIFI